MATTRGLVAVLAAGCLLLLLQKVSEDARALKVLALCVGVLGLLVAFVALIQYADKPAEILWVRTSQYAAGAFGPFVNPNHGEAFVNLTFPLLYFLLWHRSLKEKMRGNRYGLRVFIVGLFALHVTLIVISHSRGAYLSLALYPLAFLLHKGLRGQRWALAGAWLYATAVMGLALFILWVGLLGDSGRLHLYQNVPLSHLVAGNGLNSFDERWPSVITDLPLLDPVHHTHLENEYLQLFFEAGTLPALLGLVVGAWAIAWAWKGLTATRATFWLAPAFVGETIHAGADFIGHVFPILAAYLLIWTLMASAGAEKGGGGGSLRKGSHREIEPAPDQDL